METPSAPRWGFWPAPFSLEAKQYGSAAGCVDHLDEVTGRLEPARNLVQDEIVYHAEDKDARTLTEWTAHHIPILELAV